MAVDYEMALALRDEYDDEFRKRHDAFRALRRYWQGDYWRLADKESHSIVSVFRDWTARTSDVGPDVKLVHNILWAVCVKFQTFLSTLPQIRVYVDPPETDRSRAQATRKQRYLYGCWNDESFPMTKIFNWISWYLPLMGDAFLGIFPDLDKNRPVPILRSPEEAYPIPGFDGQEEAIVFNWKVREDVAARRFPGYNLRQDRSPGTRFLRKTSREQNPEIDIVEYSDKYEWHRWVDGQEVNGVEHNFGFNLFDHIKFIDVPGDIWGHGAVEQVVNMNEMHNALLSLMFEAVIENVFPRLILEDAAKAPEEIAVGPGAVIPMNPGGKAYFLNPPVGALPIQNQFLQLNEHNIKLTAGMPEVSFGQSPATSIVTGKAINELQGAGTGSTIEMVQGCGIGPGVVAWNEKAIRIGQTMFRDEKIALHGRFVDNMSVNPRSFSETIKGSQLVGSTRNEVIFQPAMAQHEKLVMWLQAKGGGLVSDQYIMEQIGIVDPASMKQEIFVEATENAVLGSILQAFQQAPTPDGAIGVEQQAYSYLQGGGTKPNPGAQPHPLLMGGGLKPPMMPGPPGPGGGPPGPPGGGPAGPPGAPPAPPPGAAPPAPAQPPQGAGNNTVTLQAAVAAFQGVQNLQGKVFLIGEIVVRGQTDSDIEVAVTVPADQDTLKKGLPQYTGRLIFHVITGEPNERFVEVTPGAPAQQGGAEKPNPEALQGVFQG